VPDACSVVRGHKCVVAVGALNDSVAFAHELLTRGASATFLLADTLGAGLAHRSSPFPAVLICENRKAEHQLEAFRNYRDTLANLPAPAVAALDDYDPQRTARLLVASQHHVPSVAGRVTFTKRSEQWMRLEDKTLVDDLWEELGITRARSRVIAVRRDLLDTAVRELDEGEGAVVAGDSREGYNSGGDYIRRVRSAADVADAYGFFSTRCARVRVMPFLSGVPCSIHGLVFPDDVAVFRPVEMFILGQRDGSRFLYAGNGTFWDPAASDREEMRTLARRLGHHLRDRVGYRGGFTVDGVMTADGFRPTELNARAGAAFGTLARSVAEVPLRLTEMALGAGLELDQDPRELEDCVVRAADLHRTGTAWAMTTTSLPSDSVEITVPPRSAAKDPNDPQSTRRTFRVDIGPSQVGGVVRIMLEDPGLAGPDPVAGEVAAIFSRLDHELGTRFAAPFAVARADARCP